MTITRRFARLVHRAPTPPPAPDPRPWSPRSTAPPILAGGAAAAAWITAAGVERLADNLRIDADRRKAGR